MHARPIRIAIKAVAVPRDVLPVVGHDGGAQHRRGASGHQQSDEQKEHRRRTHAAGGTAGAARSSAAHAHAQTLHLRAQRGGRTTTTAPALDDLGAAVLAQQDAVAPPQALDGRRCRCLGAGWIIELQGSPDHRGGVLINAVVPTRGEVVASGLAVVAGARGC